MVLALDVLEVDEVAGVEGDGVANAQHDFLVLYPEGDVLNEEVDLGLNLLGEGAFDFRTQEPPHSLQVDLYRGLLLGAEGAFEETRETLLRRHFIGQQLEQHLIVSQQPAHFVYLHVHLVL